MPLLVVGSVALDSIQTPTAYRDRVLGGSAVFFSYAASYFAPVRLVGVVGEDWPAEHTQLLQGRNIDTAGLHVVAGGKTFFWKGKYLPNMNDRETLEVELNVFGDFKPVLPDHFKRSDYVFLANGSPVTQMNTLEQVRGPKLVVADTMDLWIRVQHEALIELLNRVDGLVLNDSEARLLTGEENVVTAGRKVLGMGPKFVVVKKGEHGAVFFSAHETYTLPAYPTERVIDPTGAGDSFAGGMMGYLAHKNSFDPRVLKEAMAYGILVASFNVEDFSLERMKQIDRSDLDLRMEQYRKMLSF
ncbi:putative sugar kinase YdjH [Anatilimnocola aggregata]|uniref:Putative sugar kinase YdjH n=1 Tax=Anatilimnocola aggregata TaxID=2528021 RepID=A0A517Y7B0_9BACT|nr:PfkB family carbohydrate kinase [Anatilimnocola aggregata]QDU26117.1 putative sugar kinase YdjH [Anatilimnocola aggregata]